MTRRALLALAATSALAQSAPPSDEELQTIVAEARQVALNYTNALPNFTCDQDTDRFVNTHPDRSQEDWQPYDKFTAQISYNGVEEAYKLASVNGKPVQNRSIDSMGGTLSKGDFASALKYIFDPDSKAQFEWQSWASVRGHICYRMRYSVSQPNSHWSIRAGTDAPPYPTAYRGVVSVDQETKRTLKLTLDAVGIPNTFPIQAAHEELDYDWAVIAGRSYLLPYNLEVRMTASGQTSRNVSRYKNYRKFSADASITFHQ